jgi:hypothetical protein
VVRANATAEVAMTNRAHERFLEEAYRDRIEAGDLMALHDATNPSTGG